MTMPNCFISRFFFAVLDCNIYFDYFSRFFSSLRKQQNYSMVQLVRLMEIKQLPTTEQQPEFPLPLLFSPFSFNFSLSLSPPFLILKRKLINLKSSNTKSLSSKETVIRCVNINVERKTTCEFSQDVARTVTEKHLFSMYSLRQVKLQNICYCLCYAFVAVSIYL